MGRECDRSRDMASLESICRTVRTRLGLPPTGAPVDPDWLLTMHDELEPDPQPFCERDGLFGNKVRWNECAPKGTQKHQIGRACSAHILRSMRQLQHSPGRLSEMLCGTSAVDTQVEDIRRELYELRSARNALAHAHHPATFIAAAEATWLVEIKWRDIEAAARRLVKVVAAPDEQPRDVLLVRPRRRQ